MNNENDARKGRKFIRIIGVVIVFFSFPLALGALVSLLVNIGLMSDFARLKENGILTQAVISEINAHYRDGTVLSGFQGWDGDEDSERPSYDVFVDFVAENGEPMRVELNVVSAELSSNGHIGYVIPIYYNPDNPHDIIPADYTALRFSNIFTTGILILVGIVPLFIGLFFIFFSAKVVEKAPEFFNKIGSSKFVVKRLEAIADEQTAAGFSPDGKHSIKNSISIHIAQNSVLLCDILERNFRTYYFGHDEISGVLKIVKKKPQGFVAPLFLALMFLPFLYGGIVGEGDLSGRIVVLFLGSMSILLPAVFAWMVISHKQRTKRAVKGIEDGNYRAYEIPIEGKFKEYKGDDEYGYYIKSGEFVFRIEGKEYQSTVIGDPAVVMLFEKEKGLDFHLYGTGYLRTGKFPKRQE
ncbi:MAG: DUF3592 domain-containing protein [Oscillospiraceae bacterium]|nr:DUF3592 domain-containing protein [Oscillospiraceae bacterium]